MTLKFDYVDVADKDQGCVKLLAGYDIWYQRREVKNEDEWADYMVKNLPAFRGIGTSIPLALKNADGDPVYFTHIQFSGEYDHLQNVVFCGGICYIMNEEGKTVDIIN